MADPLVVIRTPSIVVTPPVVVAPAPAVTVNVGVPDDYVWDGTEYVGVVGDQYFYLGPDHVWLNLDAPRLARFHGWERGHSDWRLHAIHNDKYRRDAHGREVPFRDVHGAPNGHPGPMAHPGPVNNHPHPEDHHDDHHDR